MKKEGFEELLSDESLDFSTLFARHTDVIGKKEQYSTKSTLILTFSTLIGKIWGTGQNDFWKTHPCKIFDYQFFKIGS